MLKLFRNIMPQEAQVFAMRVLGLEEAWPEKSERERRWFTPTEAAAAVDEPDLKAILLSATRDRA
jgi:hypothetical protein